MNQFDLKKIACLICILIFGCLGIRCATPQKEPRTFPLTEINLEKTFHENRGLKVLQENATMIHDFYRGGVQMKEEGERLMNESRWEGARNGLEKSNQFLRVVLKYLPEDEPYRNVYGDVSVIFLPNLLIADNDLKLITIYRNMGSDNKVAEIKNDGLRYLGESLKTARTEWAYKLKNGLDEALEKK